MGVETDHSIHVATRFGRHHGSKQLMLHRCRRCWWCLLRCSSHASSLSIPQFSFNQGQGKGAHAYTFRQQRTLQVPNALCESTSRVDKWPVSNLRLSALPICPSVAVRLLDGSKGFRFADTWAYPFLPFKTQCLRRLELGKPEVETPSAWTPRQKKGSPFYPHTPFHMAPDVRGVLV